jgi:hypothetical protein
MTIPVSQKIGEALQDKREVFQQTAINGTTRRIIKA